MTTKNIVTLNNLLKELKQKENKTKANHLARFFKTGKGQYGEGDIFLGIIVPESRKLAKKYRDLPLSDISKLIKNKYHEARLIALLILVHQYKSSPTPGVGERRKEIVEFYLGHTKYINNWDLVDLSAHYIVGDYFYQNISSTNSTRQDLAGEKYMAVMKKLEKLSRSKNLWERRIAVVSTFAFIYKGKSKPTLHIVKMLLNDPEDLIHKACGWMLREVGKRVREVDLTAFLDLYSSQMPRTMLRYSIERLPEKKRLYYLRGENNTKHKIC